MWGDSMKLKFVGCLALALSLLALTVLANTKNLDWKTGTLIDVHSQSGSRTTGVMTPQSGGVVASKNYEVVFYEIDAGEMTYTAKDIVYGKNPKPLNLTVNGPVKFAIQNGNIYLQDEDGHEHKLVLEKKTLKTAPKPN